MVVQLVVHTSRLWQYHPLEGPLLLLGLQWSVCGDCRWMYLSLSRCPRFAKQHHCMLLHTARYCCPLPSISRHHCLLLPTAQRQLSVNICRAPHYANTATARHLNSRYQICVCGYEIADRTKLGIQTAALKIVTVPNMNAPTQDRRRSHEACNQVLIPAYCLFQRCEPCS